MKIVNLCKDDWANYSHDNARSLQAVGINCLDFKINAHISCYKQESQIVTTQRMSNIVANLTGKDFVQLFFSDSLLLQAILPVLGDTKLIVVHAGSTYRWDSENLNKKFNPHVWKSVIALGEFEHLGAKNPVYLIGGVDTEKYKSTYIKDSEHPVVIGHYPSSSQVKGSEGIIRVIERLRKDYQFEFKYSTSHVLHSHQIKRVSACDIYIEALNLTNNGKPYGSWGIACMEAAALGKLVITHNKYEALYNKEYGDFQPLIANDEETLYKQLKMCVVMEKANIRLMQKACRKWVEEKHSFIAIGKRYKQRILEL